MAKPGQKVDYSVNKAYDQSDRNQSGTTVVPVPEFGFSALKKGRGDSASKQGLKITVVVIVILVIALVVVAVFYAREIRDSNEETSRSFTLSTTPNLTVKSTVKPVCLEENCVSNAAEILSFMNRSADPCEDFYSFACGGWQAKTFIPTTKTSVHVFSSLVDANSQFMRNLLIDPATKSKYSSNRAVTKAVNYYQTCLSKTTINSQGDTYLKEVISSLGGSNLTSVHWNSSAYDVDEAILTTFTELGVQPFFALNVFADFMNSSIRRFAIFEGGLKIANTFYVETNSTVQFYAKTRDSYKQYMIEVMTLFGADRELAKIQMQQVYQFEEKIAAAHKDHSGQPESTTLRELSNYTNFNWTSFLMMVTRNQNYDLTEDEMILVKTKNLVRNVMDVVKNTDKAVLSNYIAWVVIEEMIDHLPDDYIDARAAYKKRIHGETYEAVKRSAMCYEAVKKAFPMPIGLIFVDKKLSTETKTRAQEIFQEIKNEFIRELDFQSWMDDETRRQAKEKAEESIIVVGYPDYIKNEERLNAEYKRINVSESSYLKTNFLIKKEEFMQKVANYKTPVDRTTFTQSPADVNAFHYRQENKNVFLAGILLAPFYDDGNLRASNYGGLGMVAGHELTHGFDHNGRLHDKNGNMANWWSRNSSLAYQRKSQCIRNQYSQFELYGKKVNGFLTLGENIADNGGLKFAFEAYKRWVSRNGKEDKLPGLDYTPYQLFYISYAQIWCSKYTRQGAYNQLDNQPWPPMNIRVEGAIMNSEGFAEAFNCNVGTRMNPANKCSVW